MTQFKTSYIVIYLYPYFQIVLIFVIAVLSSAMIVANYRQTTFWDAQSQIVFWYMVGSFADEVRQVRRNIESSPMLLHYDYGMKNARKRFDSVAWR